MAGSKMSAGWFIFKRVIWPTFDAYCDIMLAIYCVYHGVLEWGLAITLPMISNFITSLSAYFRLNRTPETIWSAEGFALPLLIWPQVQAAKVGLLMWRGERGWRSKKKKFDRNESTIEGIVEGVAQCFITAMIIIQKYVEKNKEYGYQLNTDTGRESFGPAVLVFLVISAVGSLFSGISDLFHFLLKGPLKMKLSRGLGNKVLLLTVILFGMASRFGSISIIFMFATAFETGDFWYQLLAYVALTFAFVGIQLVLGMVPLMGLAPRRFFDTMISFPHILIVPLVTPFTFGLVCDEGCCCHCCCCCGCSKPRLALSRSLSLANHIATLLLMIPPIVFFDFISSWDMGAAQLCIAVLGLIAAPILLFQPGRIIQLGVLNPEDIMQELLANVEGGGHVFKLAPAEEEKEVLDDTEKGNDTEMELLTVEKPLEEKVIVLAKQQCNNTTKQCNNTTKKVSLTTCE